MSIQSSTVEAIEENGVKIGTSTTIDLEATKERIALLCAVTEVTSLATAFTTTLKKKPYEVKCDAILNTVYESAHHKGMMRGILLGGAAAITGFIISTGIKAVVEQ